MTVSLSEPIYLLRHNVSWQEFEQILEERGDTNASRLAYDRGTLEIIVPSIDHEYFKEIISLLVQDLADELEMEYESFGSTTWKKEKQLAGIEPDNCFYFQNERLIRDRFPDINLSHDPPPDLALEIDITQKSLKRAPIYARLGVPELWRYDNGQLYLYHLEAGEYVEIQTSLAFPTVPIQAIPQFVEDNRSLGRRSLRRAFRQWISQFPRQA